MVMYVEQPWSEDVRDDLRHRIEACVELVRKGTLPKYAKEANRIEVACATRPDAATVSFLETMGVLLGDVGFGLEVYSQDAKGWDPPWFQTRARTR